MDSICHFSSKPLFFSRFTVAFFRNQSDRNRAASIRLEMTPEVDQPIDKPSSSDESSDDDDDDDEGYVGNLETPTTSSGTSETRQRCRTSSGVPHTAWKSNIPSRLFGFGRGSKNKVHPRSETVQSEGGRNLKKGDTEFYKL